MTFSLTTTFGSASLLLLSCILNILPADSAVYNESFLPEFLALPYARHLYISSHTPWSEVRIACHAWPPPPMGNITYYTRSSWTAEGSRANYPIPLHPIANSLLNKNGSMIVLSRVDAASSLTPYDLHCLASTRFGALLSPPFRIVLADANKHSGQLLVQHAVEHQPTVIPCDLPSSTLASSILFTLNGTVVRDFGEKYRIISSPGNPGKFRLVIREFDRSDVGDYRCFTRDPLTGTDWFDNQKYQLNVHESSFPVSTPSLADFPSHATPSTANVLVKQGQLVALLCIPPIPFATNAFWISQRPPSRASAGRTHLDRRFGILHIVSVSVEDEGIYYCSNGNWTSSVRLNVKRAPQVRIYPPEVRQRPGTEAFLTCVGSESVPPVWYYNGRLVVSMVTTVGSNSTLRIPVLSDSTVGLYQCIQLGADGDDWASAEAIVQYNFATILRKANFDELTSERRRQIELPPIVLSVPTGKSTRLGCTLSEDNRSTTFLADLLPGVGTASSRLRVAVALNYVQIQWRKDGVQLQLPTTQHSTEPDEFELDVVRSRDFGVYDCTVTALSSSRILFTQSIHVKPLEAWTPHQGLIPSSSLKDSHPKYETQNRTNRQLAKPVMMTVEEEEDQGDRGKRNTQQALRSSNPWDSDPIGAPQPFRDMDPNAWHSGDPLAPQRRVPQSFPPIDSNVPRLSKPNAEAVGDNLAVLVSWSPVPAEFYEIQYRHRLPIDNRWSKVLTADSMIKECCGQQPLCCTQLKQFYFTNRQPGSLEPGRRYQFRVIAHTQQSVVAKSPWSQTISFEYISKVAPVFTETERLPGGGMVARWTLSTSAVGFPVDHFLLLYRKEERYANGTITYSPFQHIFVPGSDTRECKLQNLEPGKGYQLVVYGVHTPPGMNPKTAVFRGGMGGRRITQFSHEIFVKPQLTTGEGTAREPQTLSTGGRTENRIMFSSSESNRLMFLILGALAGMMLIIMLCLVILCVWRQRRDKRRLLLYTSAAKQASAAKSLPPGQNFMLEHLNNLDNQRRGHMSEHSSAFHPQPPPMSPPPPPPKHASQRDVELSSLMSAHPPPGMYPYPTGQQPVPSSGNLHAPFNNPNVNYNQWANHNDIVGGTLPMASSQYSGQFVMPMNYQNFPAGMHSHAQPPNPPFGLKREPPSGGSVHDGTDTECEALDQGLHPQLGYQITSMAHSPFPSMAGNDTSKYPPSVISLPVMRPPSNTAQLVFDPRTQQYHHTLQHLSYTQQPHSQWSGYNPGLITPPPFNEDHSGLRPAYHIDDRISSGYPPAHFSNNEQQFLAPVFQPYNESYRHHDRQLSSPHAFQPDANLQRSTSMTAHLHYHQQQPCTHRGTNEAHFSESLRRTDTHHVPKPDTEFMVPMSYDTSSARKQRRRHRRLTAELRGQGQPAKLVDGSRDVSEPLMTSSPDPQTNTLQADSDRPVPLPRHPQPPELDGAREFYEPPNGSAYSGNRPDATFNHAAELNHPGQMEYPRHPNDELPPPNSHGIQMIPQWSQAQQQQMENHGSSTQRHGPLNYVHHNPTPSDNAIRPSWTNGILPDPPHVRDYSEYGIPNLHAANTNGVDVDVAPELLSTESNLDHQKQLSIRPLNSDNFISC